MILNSFLGNSYSITPYTRVAIGFSPQREKATLSFSSGRRGCRVVQSVTQSVVSCPLLRRVTLGFSLNFAFRNACPEAIAFTGQLRFVWLHHGCFWIILISEEHVSPIASIRMTHRSPCWRCFICYRIISTTLQVLIRSAHSSQLLLGMFHLLSKHEYAAISDNVSFIC